MKVILFLCVVFPALSCANLAYLGHDISSLLSVEAEGKAYHTQSGTVAPLETILKSGGMNAIRSRLWVNPTGGDYNLAYNVKLASRMQSAGLKIYIDVHFSDTWADPGHQTPPNGWPSDLDSLLGTVRSYTENVMATFVEAGINVDMISIGNEISNGLLWPLGKTPNYNNIGMLLKQAVLGIRAGAPKNTPKILVHLPSGSDWGTQEYFYDSVMQYKNFTIDDFDVQGVSFYPFYGTSATLANLNSTLTQMAAKYGKELIVAETDWPVACSGGPPLSEPSIPVNVSGQVEWVQKIVKIVEGVKGGAGIFYWEPAWLGNAALGSGCSDNLLFAATSSSVGTARASVNMYN